MKYVQNGLDTKVEKSRKQLKERKNRAKKIRGVKKVWHFFVFVQHRNNMITYSHAWPYKTLFPSYSACGKTLYDWFLLQISSSGLFNLFIIICCLCRPRLVMLRRVERRNEFLKILGVVLYLDFIVSFFLLLFLFLFFKSFYFF